MEEKKVEVEVDGYIIREKMWDWTLTTWEVLEEDGFDEVAILDMVFDIWQGL